MLNRFADACRGTTAPLGALLLPVLLFAAFASDDGRATTVDWDDRSATWAPVTPSYYPGAGDLDDDGDADLIVFDPTGALENTGPGSYPAWSERNDWVATLALPEGNVTAADLGDLDGDGDNDLLVSIFRVGIVYFENSGTAWAPSWTRNDDYFAYDFSWIPPVPSIVDLDGDSDADIALGGRDLNGCIWNAGSSSEPDWVVDWTAFQDIHPYGDFIDLCFGDVDGDSDLDLVTSPEGGTGILQAYENSGDARDPQWVFNLDLLAGLPQFDDMMGACLVDLSGDASPDFLTLRVFTSSCYVNEGVDTTAVADRSWGLIKAAFR